MNGKSIDALTTEELRKKCRELIDALQKARAKNPLSHAANKRHQKMKHLWGRKRTRLRTYAARLAAADKLVNPREVAAVIERILEGRG